MFCVSLGCVLGALLVVGGCEPFSGPPGNLITGDLLPLVAGRQVEYTGYAIGTNGAPLPDPGRVFRTVWVVDSAGPFTGSTLIIDTTTVFILGFGTVTRVDSFYVRKDTASGDFEFLQNLGVFFRQYKITPIGRTDTTRWMAAARKSAGLFGTWAAFDSTFVDSAGAPVRLRVNGAVEAQETITDSSSARSLWGTYRVRTSADVFVRDTIVVSNRTLMRLWLAPDVGPVQVHIAEDAENVGYFRIMKSKNF